MKFLIKTLGWDRWRDEVLDRRSERRSRAEGGRRALPFDPDAPPIEERPERAVAAAAIDAVRAADRVVDAGHRARASRRASTRSPSDERACRGVGVDQRPAAAAAGLRGRRSSDLLLGDVTAGQLRVLARLARGVRRRDDPADAGSEPVPAVGAGSAAWPCLFDVSPRRALRAAGASTIADVTSCPGRRVVQARRHAVARPGSRAQRRARRASRSRARAPDARHQDQRLSERLRPASHRDARLPGQRAQGRRPRRAAVLRDGRRRVRHRRRHVRPARRKGARRGASTRRSSACSTGIARDREGEESPQAFFARVPVPRSEALLADLRSVRRGKARRRGLHRPGGDAQRSCRR